MKSKNLFQLRVQTPHYATFGEEGDISNICQFGWYEWLYLRETTGKFPYPSPVLGRCLGPEKNEGNKILQWVLNQHGQIVPRKNTCKLTPGEFLRESEIKKREVFDSSIKTRYGESFTLPKIIKRNRVNPQDDDGTFDLPFDEVAPEIPEADITDAERQPLHPSSVAHIIMNAEVLLPQGGSMRLEKFIRSNVDSDGKVIGDYNDILT